MTQQQIIERLKDRHAALVSLRVKHDGIIAKIQELEEVISSLESKLEGGEKQNV